VGGIVFSFAVLVPLDARRVLDVTPQQNIFSLSHGATPGTSSRQ
jgi:hypothetical protein